MATFDNVHGSIAAKEVQVVLRTFHVIISMCLADDKAPEP
jgi:hypothetical protein